MRGAGGTGAEGAVATGATEGAVAEADGAAGVCIAGGTCTAGGIVAGRGGGLTTEGEGGTGATTGRGATGAATGAPVAAGEAEGVDGAGLVTAGATVVGRLTAAGGAATGLSTLTGPAGVAGGGVGTLVGAASFRCVIAFNTSPGREMFERSILVLISSSPRSEREAALPAGDEPSAEERM